MPVAEPVAPVGRVEIVRAAGLVPGPVVCHVETIAHCTVNVQENQRNFLHQHRGMCKSLHMTEVPDPSVDNLLADPDFNPLGAEWDDVKSSVWDQVNSRVWDDLGPRLFLPERTDPQR